MFVGSADGGRLFHFDLNDHRNGLVLDGNLSEKIAVNSSDFGAILLAEGFSIITDVKKGPDGNLYIVSGLKLSKTEKFGAVFRIVPLKVNNSNNNIIASDDTNNTNKENMTKNHNYNRK